MAGAEVDIRDVLEYLARYHPSEHYVSPERFPGRLVKLAYLADWKAAIEYGSTLTPLVWRAGGDPPPEALEAARHAAEHVESSTRRSASGRILGSLTTKTAGEYEEYPSLASVDYEILAFVLGGAARREPLYLARLVFSTYPMLSARYGDPLDLPVLARHYVREVRPLLRGGEEEESRDAG